MPAPAMEPSVRGRFLWYELLTTDTDGAKAFYTEALGWNTTPFPGAGASPYTLWTQGDVPLGGMMSLPEDARAAGAPSNWLAYVGTPDLDGTVSRAQTLNASVLAGPMDVPDVGRIAVMRDPQGAVFAIYTPKNEPSPEVAAELGHVSWHELATTDPEAAFGFYQNLFGWVKTEAMDMGPLGIYQMFGRGKHTYGGIYNKPAEMPAPPHWLLYVRVDDVHASVPRITQNGGHILNGPMEVPGGDFIAQCLDPQGAAFAIHSKKK